MLLTTIMLVPDSLPLILSILTLAANVQITATTSQPDAGECFPTPFRDGVGDGRLRMVCHLTAINSEEERTNFSVIPADHTASLTIKCIDQSVISYLEPRGFKSLVWLEELSIQDCNLETIPDKTFVGLTRLTSLNIKSSTNGELSFSRGSFDGLANLQNLDISDNRVRFIERGVLCSMPNLGYLNLSSSDLDSVSELGLTTSVSGANCLRNVKTLDLSRNRLTSIRWHEMEAGGKTSQNSLFSFPNMEKLLLSHNLIRSLDEDSLAFINSNSVHIDLSNNLLTYLPPNIFSFSTFKHVSLANNSITSLPNEVFSNQRNLEYLDLSGNDLQSSELKPTLFAETPHLTQLYLNDNRFDRLKRRLLWDVESLEILDLSSNKIEELPYKLFKSQTNLKTLKLSNNLLTKLSSDSLLGTEKLNHLMLDNNLLKEINDGVFSNFSRLSMLDLSNNNLVEIPKSLRFLKNLKSLDLSHNLIRNLVDLSLSQLFRLDLSWNKIENITVAALQHLISLQILDLSNNKIEEVERGSFDFTKLIRAVRLDSNYLKRMDNLFHQLPNLTWLNISDNQIEMFDYAMVPRNLLWLDLHRNKIQSLDNYFGIEDGTTLQHIDASYNRITNIGPLNVPKSIEILILNDNDIVNVASFTFSEKSNLKKVDLSVNKLNEVDRNSIRVFSNLINLPKFFLGGNPIECDCEMVWLKTINEKNVLQNLPHIADLESIYCKLPYSLDQTFAPLVDANPLDFLCSYKTHCFALCHCCDYDACDCEMSCPHQCSCFHDNTWTKNIAQCSNANYTDLPAKLPMDATELYLDGNNIGKLKSHTFIGRKNLQVLYLNDSNIELVENNTFNDLRALTILHLESNKITKLEGDEFQGLTNLRELYLQDNQITYINNVTFRILQSLEVLYLQGNRIVDYPVWLLSNNPHLVSVRLVENLWSCDCLFVHQFKSWLENHRTKVHQAELVACRSNQVDQQGPIHYLNHDGAICEDPRKVEASHIQTRHVTDYLPLVLVSSVVIIVIIITCLLMFLYNNEIRVWLHSKYGIRFFQRVDNTENDCDKIFDVFVIYSGMEDQFVNQIVAPELELGANHYKLCLYHRDLPSVQYVADAIVQASDASRRTVIILSDSFLKQDWSRYDFRSGVQAAMRVSGKRTIVIMLGDIKERDLDPELRLYLKTCTVVRWGDSKFWQKLKFSLPDLSVSAMSQSTTLQSYPASIHSVQYNTSSELYRPLSPRYQALPRQSDHIYQVCY